MLNWEQDLASYESFLVSQPAEPRLGPFARTAQSALLLGRALKNVYDPITLNHEFNRSEAQSIVSTLEALHRIVPCEAVATCTLYCGSLGLCHRYYSFTLSILIGSDLTLLAVLFYS